MVHRRLKYIAIAIATLWLAIFMAVPGAAQIASSSPTAADGEPATGAPVVLNDDIVYVIQTRFGEISPEQRARSVSRKLQKLAEDPAVPIDSIQVGDQDQTPVIFSGNQVLAYVTPADAEAAGTAASQLAEQQADKIRDAIATLREAPSLSTAPVLGRAGVIQSFFKRLSDLTSPDENFSLLRALLFTVITTVLFALAYITLNTLFPRLHHNLQTARQMQRAPGIRLRNIDLLTGDQIIEFLIELLQLVRWVLTLLLLGVYILVVFGFFPWTRQFEAGIISYALDSIETIWNAFIDYIPKLFTIALIAGIAYYTIRIIRPFFSRLASGEMSIPGFYAEWAQPTYRIIEVLLLAMTAIIILPYLPGFGSPAFQGISIFLGVLVSLGSTAAVANAVSGIILIYTRAFQVGDRIKIGNTIGNVEEKSLLVTRLRTWDNLIVTLPNANLLSNNIVNYSALLRESSTPPVIHVNITLGYDVPWRQVYELLSAAALATPGILPEPSPFVRQVGLGDFSVSYNLCAYTDRPTQMEGLRSTLRQNMQDKCNEAGIEILSPTYSAVRDGHQSTLPEEYLPDDYQAAGFQVNPLGNLIKLDLSMGNGKKPPENSSR